MTDIIKKIVLGLGILAFILLVVFIVQNADAVMLRFIKWEFNISLSLLIFIVVAIGFFGGYIYQYSVVHIREKRMKHIEYVNQIESENRELKLKTTLESLENE